MQPRLPGIISPPGRGAATTKKEPLQVRIPGALKRQFKAHAALRGLEPNELFAEVWAHYHLTVIQPQEKK